MKAAQVRSLLRICNMLSGVPNRYDVHTEMEDFYRSTDRNDVNGKMIVYDEWIVRRYIEKITVCKDSLEIHFKAGIKIDVAD